MPIDITERTLIRTGIYFLRGELNEVNTQRTVEHILSCLPFIVGKFPSLTVIIHSTGGNIEDAFFLHDFLRDIDENVIPVRTVAGGYCFSGATLVLQGGRIRLSYPYSNFHIHQVLLSSSEESLSEVISSAKFTIKLQEKYFKLLVDRSNGKLNMRILKSKLKMRDWWFDAQEAYKYGIVDEIIKGGNLSAVHLPSERGGLLIPIDFVDRGEVRDDENDPGGPSDSSS